MLRLLINRSFLAE